VLVPAANVVVGKWLATVGGTAVPQAPQDYSLACEGCVAGQHASLLVTIAPAGSGTVSGAGIACAGDCWEVYNLNDTVVLNAAAGAGFAFDSWTGCDSPVGATCTMTMDGDKLVTANFQPVATLDVVIAPPGGGGVTGTGINCPADCTEQYLPGTVVVLDAVASVGYAFDSWTGCDSPSGATCTMTMNTDKTVAANFRAVAALDVVIAPSGGGSVTGTGIDCPTDCSEVYDLNTVVVLDAVANAGYAFDSWTGCDSPVGAACTMTMDGDKTVAANYREIASLDVVIIPSGGGSVTGDGIDCPTDCTELYDLGATVILTAIPNSVYNFLEWTGCDSVSSNTCTVILDENTTVSAQFVVKVPVASRRGLATLIALIAIVGVALLRRWYL